MLLSDMSHGMAETQILHVDSWHGWRGTPYFITPGRHRFKRHAVPLLEGGHLQNHSLLPPPNLVCSLATLKLNPALHGQGVQDPGWEFGAGNGKHLLPLRGRQCASIGSPLLPNTKRNIPLHIPHQSEFPSTWQGPGEVVHLTNMEVMVMCGWSC